MITTKSNETDYLTEFTDGVHEGVCDAPESMGGAGAGFTPLALLEASLAACMNITLRMYARNHAIPLDSMKTTVSITREVDGAVVEYSAEIPERLAPGQKKRLFAAMRGCPIHSILAKNATFSLKDE